mmetsp:Transcript_30771/g.76982  ORF Transcript_30771/g.76982 Transcript_30771/m.76982 type:complete len:186 (+) Transcript_30771:174-731(+)
MGPLSLFLQAQISRVFSAASDGAERVACRENGARRSKRLGWKPLEMPALDWGSSTSNSVATAVVNGLLSDTQLIDPNVAVHAFNGGSGEVELIPALVAPVSANLTFRALGLLQLRLSKLSLSGLDTISSANIVAASTAEEAHLSNETSAFLATLSLSSLTISAELGLTAQLDGANATLLSKLFDT